MNEYIVNLYLTRSSIYARELTLFSQLTRLHKDDAVTGQANVLGKILGQILSKSNFVVSLTHWHFSPNYVHLTTLAPHLNSYNKCAIIFKPDFNKVENGENRIFCRFLQFFQLCLILVEYQLT